MSGVYYSGGPYVNSIITPTGYPQPIIDQIKAALLFCRWTVAATTHETDGVTGYWMDSRATTDGNKHRLKLGFSGRTISAASYTVDLTVCTILNTHSSPLYGLSAVDLNTDPGKTFRIWASPHHVFIFPGSTSSGAHGINIFMCGSLLNGFATDYCFWSQNGAGDPGRTFMHSMTPANSAAHFVAKKSGGSVYEASSDDVGFILPSVLTSRNVILSGTNPVKFIGTDTWPVTLPWMLATPDAAATMLIIGAMPDACVVGGPYPRELTGTFDNHPWEVLCWDYPTGAIWVVTGPALSTSVGGFSH